MLPFFLFVCMSTKTVYLEYVTELSTKYLLTALYHFTSRWGHPREICSDKGRNFLGAAQELKEIYQFLVSQHAAISDHLVSRGLVYFPREVVHGGCTLPWPVWGTVAIQPGIAELTRPRTNTFGLGSDLGYLSPLAIPSWANTFAALLRSNSDAIFVWLEPKIIIKISFLLIITHSNIIVTKHPTSNLTFNYFTINLTLRQITNWFMEDITVVLYLHKKISAVHLLIWAFVWNNWTINQ